MNHPPLYVEVVPVGTHDVIGQFYCYAVPRKGDLVNLHQKGQFIVDGVEWVEIEVERNVNTLNPIVYVRTPG